MTLHSAEAILLDVFDLHDQDRIVTALTRERGKVRGVARGARRKYSRFAGQLRPLSKVRLVWFEKEGRELVRISSVDLLRSAAGLQSDLEGILLGSCLAEHMLEFAQENEESDHLFRLLDSTLEALAAGADRDLAARYFEAWVLRLAGIFPAPRSCPACGRALAGEGAVLPAGDEGLVCVECGAGGGRRLSAAAVELLLRIGARPLEELDREPPPKAVLEEVGELSARVRRAFLQRELKSYRVMRDTLERAAPSAVVRAGEG